MRKLQVVSPYEPAGDQGNAIKELSQGIIKGEKFLTLKGVTGSGKTFTMAKIIEEVQKPTLVISHNKTLAAQLYKEFKNFFHVVKVFFLIISCSAFIFCSFLYLILGGIFASPFMQHLLYYGCIIST